jgi:hypothetical protein
MKVSKFLRPDKPVEIDKYPVNQGVFFIFKGRVAGQALILPAPDNIAVLVDQG